TGTAACVLTMRAPRCWTWASCRGWMTAQQYGATATSRPTWSASNGASMPAIAASAWNWRLAAARYCTCRPRRCASPCGIEARAARSAARGGPVRQEHGGGRGDVEAFHRAGARNRDPVLAGAGQAGVHALAFGAHHVDQPRLRLHREQVLAIAHHGGGRGEARRMQARQRRVV